MQSQFNPGIAVRQERISHFTGQKTQIMIYEAAQPHGYDGYILTFTIPTHLEDFDKMKYRTSSYNHGKIAYYAQNANHRRFCSGDVNVNAKRTGTLMCWDRPQVYRFLRAYFRKENNPNLPYTGNNHLRR
mmetsp:Transcript_49338/g.56669  ORF Transcript_49338/g.56669 Transcript_49338/m.56669 type:complete len:130 (+) Transcript_49338:147-536(+)